MNRYSTSTDSRLNARTSMSAMRLATRQRAQQLRAETVNDLMATVKGSLSTLYARYIHA